MRLYIYILKILISIAIAIAGIFFSFSYVYEELLSIKELGYIVLSVFLIGLLFSFIRLYLINSKINWIKSYKASTKVAVASVASTPRAFFNIENKISGNKQLSLQEYYNAVKSLDASFSHNKDAGKFFAKLCFMVGFLGSFMCIMLAVGDIANIFTNTNLDLTDSISTLSSLQSELSSPLVTLKSSFAISFFGIYLYCLLSYIDRQVFVAENKFLGYAEDWLLSCTNQKNK